MPTYVVVPLGRSTACWITICVNQRVQQFPCGMRARPRQFDYSRQRIVGQRKAVKNGARTRDQCAVVRDP